MTTEELLNEMEQEAEFHSEETPVCVIDPETRTINVPASETLFGVKGDKNIERKYFTCPRIVGDNVDLSTHLIYIAYVYTESNSGSIFPSIGIQPYHCDDVEIDGDNITFSWQLSDHVFQSAGFIAFKMYAKEKEDSPYTVFNTAPAVGTVLYTIGDGVESVVSEYPDIINQLLAKMEGVQEIATPEAMQNYVNAYLTENPMQGGITSNASSLLITILRSGVFNSDQSSNITELEKELQGNGSEEGGDDSVKYGLHNAAGYTGKLETGLKTTTMSLLNIDKIVLDIDIKTDTMPTTKYTLICYYFTQTLVINASGKWVFNGSETNVIADKTPDDVMGNGRTTITFSNLTGVSEGNQQQWELMGGNAQETPETIWYNVKFYSGDTLKADLTPTSKLGDMYDSVSEKTRSFSEIDGLELVEVK